MARRRRSNSTVSWKECLTLRQRAKQGLELVFGAVGASGLEPCPKKEARSKVAMAAAALMLSASMLSTASFWLPVFGNLDAVCKNRLNFDGEKP
ncbi:hypothetical protein Droror1_Dr00009431 [Drosera rotundifolia]